MQNFVVRKKFYYLRGFIFYTHFRSTILVHVPIELTQTLIGHTGNMGNCACVYSNIFNKSETLDWIPKLVQIILNF